VEWLSQQVPVLFHATGTCEEAALPILGLSPANWTLLTFGVCLAVGAWALVHEYRADRPLTVGPSDRRTSERRSHERRSKT
jgi:disulfide bond formation protein DsbB